MTAGGPLASAGAARFAPALTSIIGRDAEVSEVCGLLAEYGLVTVTGPGGVGKTRLAAEVADRVQDRFADGAWLVELAGVQDPVLVPETAAAALGIVQPPGASALDSLLAALARRQLLLVLDNCEHVLADAAALCVALLPAADDVRVLATSREPLAVAGEARYRLSPLAVPATDDEPEQSGSAAMLLFADRARRAEPHFTLGPDTAPAAARIVRQLDGMPLAIELAAARVEALGLDQLAAGLDSRLLAGGHRLAASRQRSLTAAAEWSYQLLTEPEQAAFRRLALFPGPFTLAAAEDVAGPEAGPAVLRLVDCSLLVPPRTGPDQRARYLMLQTLRSYGMDRLAAAGEQQAASAALAGYAVRVAEQAAAGLETSTGELAAAQWLDAEDAVVHQGLAWALGHDTATALRLAIALAPWWSLRSRYTAGQELLTAAAARSEQGGPDWCAAQIWLGRLASGIGEVTGLAHFTAALDGLGNAPSRLLVQALAGSAHCLTNLGRLAEAAGPARRALKLADALGYPVGQVRALYWLGAIAYNRGDLHGALGAFRQAQQIDPAAIPGSLVRRCGIVLAAVLSDVGELAEAGQVSARVLAQARQAGAVFDLADGLLLAANIDLQAGRLPEVRVALREAVELVGRLGQDALLLDCLDLCGHLCTRTGRPAEAISAWSACVAIRERAGLTDPVADAARRQEPLRAACQALGSARAQAEQRGAAMTPGAAAEFAALLAADDARQAGTADAGRLPRLSAREQELVTLVARGQTNAQIAGQLYISVRTVGSHLDRIRDKTGCRRRADLTRLALQAGLV